MADVKLKPCPFCGGKAYVNTYGDGSSSVVCLNRLCLVSPQAHGFGGWAVRRWNTRKEARRG